MNRDLPLEPIDERVRVVARAFAYPPTPDIAGAAQRRLAEGGSRSTQARGPAALAPRLRLTWVVVALLVALLTAGGMYVVMLNVFVKTQAETRVDLESLKGFRGQVLVPIRPGQPGQIVVVTEARGRTLLQAIADEAIGTDEHVVVDSAVGNSVKVHKV